MDVRPMKKAAAPLLAAALVSLLSGQVLEAQEVRGYIGVRVECKNCRLETKGDVTVWRFATPPVINWVHEAGPAARAGLQTGDVILAVDGVDILDDEGGRQFGLMRAGVPMELRVRRDGDVMTVDVTPTTQPEAFGEAYAYVVQPGRWDSMRVQLKRMSEQQFRLRDALRVAERAFQEAQARRASEEHLELADQYRLQIDSMRKQLTEWNLRLRVQADSLAARTLYVMPAKPPMVELVVPAAPEARAVLVYSNAVAGARFEQLDKDDALAEYFPGVEAGLLITKIVEGTPAYSAGLREGDVVLAVDGESVATVAELRRRLREADEAELTYVRKGEKLTCVIPSQ